MTSALLLLREKCGTPFLHIVPAVLVLYRTMPHHSVVRFGVHFIEVRNLLIPVGATLLCALFDTMPRVKIAYLWRLIRVIDSVFVARVSGYQLAREDCQGTGRLPGLSPRRVVSPRRRDVSCLGVRV